MSDLHDRTRLYTGGAVADAAVGVTCGDAVGTPGGQAALLGLVNAAVRNHPTVFVAVPDAEALVGGPATVDAALAELTGATGTSTVERVAELPAGLPTVGIGDDVSADLYVDARRFTGAVSSGPAAMSAEASNVFGAAMAAMLAANYLFRSNLRLPADVGRGVSLWALADADGPTGPAEVPKDHVGSVWIVGAGGVGSSAAWWQRMIGPPAQFTVIDHETIDVTNLNRSLGMFHATSGLETGAPLTKADAAVALTGGAPFVGTWDSWAATDPASPDVLIPAANDLGVRAAIASYSHPTALTGTTSRNWTAELHRYRAGIDGCCNCRHPLSDGAQFACATVPITEPEGSHKDAALSFLSGAAGLLTVAALHLLAAGQLDMPFNNWQVAFDISPRRVLTQNIFSCDLRCARTMDARSRGTVHGGTRWFT